jgi:hypothetical protein
MSSSAPAVCVVVVSDYGGGPTGDWDYLRNALRALSMQTFGDDVEVMLVDTAPAEQTMPEDLARIAPSTNVIRDHSRKGSDLVNAVARACGADLVVLLDADCVPAPGWLTAAVGAMRLHPDAAVVSGLTTYPDEGFTYRVLALLLRAFVDPGSAGRTRFITANNAIFRRGILVGHPLPPVEPRHLALRLQTESIRAAGGKLYFEPDMRATHRFDGWPNERKIRRRVGYRAVQLRQLDSRASHSWLVRLGVLAIPLIVAGRTVDSWRDCVRAGRHFGVRWFELPAAFVLAVAVHLLEIGGMLAAFSEARAERVRAPDAPAAASRENR